MQQSRVAQSPLILLVEHHHDSRALYKFDLKRFGFRVEEAESASQAMRHVASSTPDVIVTDWGLPDIDGRTFCRMLKARPLTKDVPVIVLTGHADAQTARLARDAGCMAVLVKPCLPTTLRAEIARVLAVAREARTKTDALLERAHVLSRQSAALKMQERAQARTAGRLIDPATSEDLRVVRVQARVRAEFQEMPGLRLSVEQAARFLGLERSTADQILDRLVQDGFLHKTTLGLYCLAA
jgi:CheY-like chemotaxis protein